MKVLQLVTRLGMGGTELQLVELLRALASSDWSSTLLTLRPPDELNAPARELAATGVEMVPMPESLAHPGTVAVVARLARRIRAERIALVHCHDVYATFLGVPAARLAGVPSIAARRDLAHHLGRLQRLTLGLLLRAASRVLANSRRVAQQARAWGIPDHRIAVVPNGLDLEAFDARARLEPLPPSPFRRRPTVLTVANPSYPAKGHDDLLAAAALVAARRPEVHFLVAGTGPRDAELRERARTLGLAATVDFLGRRADVPSLLARADLVCHPARAEGMPNGVLEAMAAGRPIVATDAGGTTELVQHDRQALVVPTYSPPELATAIRRLLDEPERARELGNAARRRVEERFTSRHLAARIDALYRSVARG